jgi:plastocyanin
MKALKINSAAILVSIAALAAIVFSGCSNNDKGTNPGGGGNYSHLVTINNFAFSPTPITVSAGDTVTWRNDQNVGHTVTSDQGSELGSPTIGQGQIYQHVFADTGSYAYHCTPHPTMHGTVIVH